jgi:hypothetical protein
MRTLPVGRRDNNNGGRVARSGQFRVCCGFNNNVRASAVELNMAADSDGKPNKNANLEKYKDELMKRKAAKKLELKKKLKEQKLAQIKADAMQVQCRKALC